ncbi:potassium channel family protein [Melghirimyces algeriensis]|uniref:Voltage-gated potassium channel n=1 Tax=Melghirimyces algeriensis TaxID=910412 RepID=A0A521D068_9BACL|nr:potassium channel family protein [Melghirimyces algeriensis]SMO65117.1 voltage-gated potassium channel [Melghirimyces algeriensis]
MTLTYTIVLVSQWLDVHHQNDWMMDRLQWFDRMLLIWFAVEYLVRFWVASHKKRFVLENWFDLLAIIPLDEFFRPLRLLRLIRLIRLIRMSSFLWGFIRTREVQLSILVATVIVFWGSGGFYLLEKDFNEGIQSFNDAIWWAIVTTTTVGYGDISPVTFGGRMIAIVLMLTGIGLIGSVTASVATHFNQVLKEHQREQREENQIREELMQTAKQYIEQINQLSPAEYQTLLRTLETLRSQDSPKKDKME